MKKVMRMMALFAVVATAAFMTGCGDDDHDNNNNNNNNTVNAPAIAALQGKTFTLGNGGSIALSPAGNTYTYTPQGGAAENGTYQYTPVANNATLVTVSNGDGTQTTYNLSFTGAANGQYAGTITRTPQGGTQSSPTTFHTSGTNNNPGGGGNTNTNTALIAPTSVTGKNYLVTGGTNGTFTLSFPSSSTYTVAAGGTAIETGSYTYTGSSTTNTATIALTPTTEGATPHTVNLVFSGIQNNAEAGSVTDSSGGNGTFTQTGSNGVNNNQGGGGTTPAPAALHSLHVTSTGGPFLGADYTLTLNGNGNSGTFEVGGGSTGSGTYTYSANGNTGVLTLNYTSEGAVGDIDMMNLAFTSASSGTFTGSQTTGGVQHNDFTGNFTNAQ